RELTAIAGLPQGHAGEHPWSAVGCPSSIFFEPVCPEIQKLVSAAIRQLESAGATRVEVDIPDLENCSAMEAHITLAEATSYHEPYLKKQPDDYGPAV